MRSLGLLSLLLFSSQVAGASPIEPSATAMDTLLLAGDHGIQEVDLEGKVLRTISKTPAREGRYLARREGVLFLGADYSLWTVMLADGLSRRLARLPRTVKSCDKTPEYP